MRVTIDSIPASVPDRHCGFRRTTMDAISKLLAGAGRKESALGPIRLYEARIQRGQRYIERLGEGNIPAIVYRDVLPKLPNSLSERLKTMELHVEIDQILESTICLVLGDHLTSLEAANHICHLNGKVLRSVQVVLFENLFCPDSVRARINQRCYHNRGVDDYAQRRSASRASRISSTVTRLCAALLRRRTCCNHASIDGRSTIRRSSAWRNSCMDLPCRAARAANSSRTFSGTSRIVI